MTRFSRACVTCSLDKDCRSTFLVRSMDCKSLQIGKVTAGYSKLYHWSVVPHYMAVCIYISVCSCSLLVSHAVIDCFLHIHKLISCASREWLMATHITAILLYLQPQL